MYTVSWNNLGRSNSMILFSRKSNKYNKTYKNITKTLCEFKILKLN